jgi:hypothetical protein
MAPCASFDFAMPMLAHALALELDDASKRFKEMGGEAARMVRHLRESIT